MAGISKAAQRLRELQSSERVSIESVLAHFGEYQKCLSFWRWYPDYLLDALRQPSSTISLFFYQRIFLRVCFRYNYVFAVFTRAYSKSFMAILVQILKCILFPRTKLFIAAAVKEQAASIAKEKIDDILTFWPGLVNELDVGMCIFSKDFLRLVFKNKSYFEVTQISESSRGQRKYGGLIEEVASITNGAKINEVIIPMMNVNRMAANGEVDLSEKHKSQIYVTTAGHAETFAYDKQIQLLILQVIKKNAFVFGGSWRIPVLHGLLDKNFISEMKADGTFTVEGFNREYESRWSMTNGQAYYSPEMFDKLRTLRSAEYENKIPVRSRSEESYYFGIDVARNGCQTVVSVFRVRKDPAGGYSFKQLVNLYVIETDHFEKQALAIKKLAKSFAPAMITIDANGLGIGLVDFLVIDTIDKVEGIKYDGLGVMPISDKHKDYINYRGLPVLNLVKANASINTEMYSNLQTHLNSGKIEFLVDDKTANILHKRTWAKFSPEERTELLSPYITTSILKEELVNLVPQGNGLNLQLKQFKTTIGKDKVSSLVLGLYGVKQSEEQLFNRRQTFVENAGLGSLYTPSSTSRKATRTRRF